MTAVPARLLAPLRGVTIRCFRETFAAEIASAGFAEAVTPFLPAMPGCDPLRDRELRGANPQAQPFAVVPQFIGKDPASFAACLERTRDAGYATADLNAGCPFPMVRNKGRGSGLLRTPDVLDRMLEAGCSALGANGLSVKARLGVERADELLALMPVLNRYPLRFLTVHARTARQMYAGTCDRVAFEAVAAAAKMPVVYNGDAALSADSSRPTMIGRDFVRDLGRRDDAADLLRRYADASGRELCGDRPVLGRLKELVSYWAALPRWCRRWRVAKLARSVDEFIAATC